MQDDPWHKPEFLAEKVKDYHKRVGKVESDLNGFGGRVQRMDKEQGKLETKVEALDKSVEKIFDKIDSMQTKIAGIVVGLQVITIIVLKYWK